jgi:hypothetical protein
VRSVYTSVQTSTSRPRKHKQLCCSSPLLVLVHVYFICS